MTDDPTFDRRFVAAIDMLRRTGATEVQYRYSDDEEPTLWMVAVAHHLNAERRPVAPTDPTSQGVHWDCAGGMSPYRAAFRLLEVMLDGGTCAHCGRTTGVTEHFDPMPGSELVCWTQYDPELNKFRRSCE